MTTLAEKQIMTKERFEQGLTWADYMASIKANKEKFQKFYDDFRVNADDAAFFKAFNEKKGPVKVVVIGEDWCPDVVRGIPVAVRLAEAAGFDLRIFPRDENKELMAEYMWRHQFESIPVFVFFDKDWKELGHFVERPATGYKMVADLREELARNNLSDEEVMQRVRAAREEAQMQWMDDTIKELKEQLFYRVL